MKASSGVCRATRSFEARGEVLLDTEALAEGLPSTADSRPWRRRRRWWKKQRQWEFCRRYDNIVPPPTRAVFRSIWACAVLVQSWKSEQTISPSTPDSGLLLEYERSPTQHGIEEGPKGRNQGGGVKRG